MKSFQSCRFDRC